MTYQLTIVGLGEIGTSLGLALAEQKDQLYRVGCDLKKTSEKNAEEIQAVDKIVHNIFDATKDADIIIFAIPADEVRKTLELIGHEIKDSAVIIDFCPTKKAAASWAARYMKDPSHFIGVWGEFNPKLLQTISNRSESACKNLFTNGAFFICPGPDTDKDVIQNAAAIAQMADAFPCYCDIEEIDGLTASTFTAPYLLEAALFTSVANQIGWIEGRKSAGRSFAIGTGLMNQALDQDDQSFTLINNRENTVRAINTMVAELKKYRDALQSMDEVSLNQMLKNALDKRDEWLAGCSSAKWFEDQNQTHIPDSVSASSTYSQMLFGNLFGRKKKDN